MLDGTKKEWDTSFAQASNLLESHPNRLEALKKIHEKPAYYSKWYLSNMEGHFNHNGLVPAEQNHASGAHQGTCRPPDSFCQGSKNRNRQAEIDHRTFSVQSGRSSRQQRSRRPEGSLKFWFPQISEPGTSKSSNGSVGRNLPHVAGRLG